MIHDSYGIKIHFWQYWHILPVQWPGKAVRSLHAHPPVSTAYTLLGRPFPDNIHTEGRGVLGTVGTVPYISPASDALANACADALKEMNVILMAHLSCSNWMKLCKLLFAA